MQTSACSRNVSIDALVHALVNALVHALVHAFIDALVRAPVHDLVCAAGRAIPARVKLMNDFGEIITLLEKEVKG